MKALFLNKTGGAKKKGGATSDRLYLDYAAAAPILPSVIEAVTDVLRDGIANPSSIHEDGVQAKAIMERARKEIAEEFEAHADEIIFTGSGTESDNLAILGSVTAALAGGAFPNGAHVITTVIEHHAVLAACDALEKRGVAVTRLPVAQDGLLDVKTLRDALRPETVLVTVGYANSEVGTVQPVREIAKAIRHFKKQTGHHDARYPLFHTDACQAAPYLSLRVPELGVDLLTVNGAKLGGPCGIGMLYARRGTSLSPVTYGGGQERGLRSGTEDVASIVGFATALTESRTRAEKETQRLSEMRDICLAEIKERFPQARVNGSLESRLPQNIHVSFPGYSSELLVLELDAKGISVSAGSACGATSEEVSHVLEALYEKTPEQWGSIRVTVGYGTRERDLFTFLDALQNVFEKYKPWVLP